MIHRGRGAVIQGSFPQRSRQPNAANSSVWEVPPAALRFPAGPGQPLPSDVRQRMEAAFGTSFADVRIHIGPVAASIGAAAFTHGSDIHFAPNQYDPTTERGQRILGRELAHVVQQRAGRVHNPLPSAVAVVNNRQLEAEANRMAMRVAQPKGAVVQRVCRTCGAKSHSTSKCPKNQKPKETRELTSEEIDARALEIYRRMTSKHHPKTGVKETPKERLEERKEENLAEIRERLKKK